MSYMGMGDGSSWCDPTDPLWCVLCGNCIPTAPAGSILGSNPLPLPPAVTPPAIDSSGYAIGSPEDILASQISGQTTAANAGILSAITGQATALTTTGTCSTGQLNIGGTCVSDWLIGGLAAFLLLMAMAKK
jgi:hypothetical protein